MPLVGGGGAGNTAGSNPSGTGTTLNYIGGHCFAYSGLIRDEGSGSAATTLLDFTMGNSYAVVDFSILANNISATSNNYINIIIDGESVLAGEFTKGFENISNPITLLLPAYSRVQIKWGSQGSYDATAVIAGRVYA